MIRGKLVTYFSFVCMMVGCLTTAAQPQLVHNAPYAPVGNVGYDSTHRRIYINFLNGCPTWNIPCALNYTFSSMYNLVNKHHLSDNSLSQVLGSKNHTSCPAYPVNQPGSVYAHQSLVEGSFIYTNFGYYFDKIDTNLALNGPVWSYSPAVSPSTKEIMSFTMRNDSLFLFQKDSTNGWNYYNLILKNKQTGADIPYSSLTVTNIASPKGSISGYIRNTELFGNKILITGNFNAYLSGNFLCRNMVLLDIVSGSLSATPLTLAAGTQIFDLKKHNGKYYISGNFTEISGQNRYAFAGFDSNFNLLPNTPSFSGEFMIPTWVDQFVIYDRYLIAKGNYGFVNQVQVSLGNTYQIRAVDMTTGSLMNWTLNIPPPVTSFNVFQLHRNKLFIKNQGAWGSPFYIYCLDPVLVCSNIVYPGSNLPNPSPSVSICAPDSGNDRIFVAPIRFADSYQWTYTGNNATVVPGGNGSTAKLITSTLSTAGILSVTAYNDCGMSKTATLNVIINQKPVFTPPVSPLKIICNPDSTLLQSVSTESNLTFQWRHVPSGNYTAQPVYVKQPGNYYSIVTNTLTGCSDSSQVTLLLDQNKPNATILSHNYISPVIPIDTLTCLQPSVSILGSSDSSGVNIQWKSISGTSVFPNPYTTAQPSNIKLVVTNTVNACADSSLIVLVSQNTLQPSVAIPQKTLSINCSTAQVQLSAIVSPTSCSTAWSNSLNPGLPNPCVTGTTGIYYVNVTDPENGCTRKDSAKVIYEPRIQMHVSNDTLVCKGSVITLSASPLGNLNNLSYAWSTGSSFAASSVQAFTSARYYVAITSGSCTGKDSVLVSVPPDIKDSILTFKDCNEQNKGNIVVFAKGGIPPYKFALNNSPVFSVNNTFSSLSFGNYLVSIKDSIGCLVSKSVTLSNNAQTPVPKFLASTRNQKGDTLVLVDISIPKADSVHWMLPPGISKVGGSMHHPVLTASDTGSYSIGMKGYYGNCHYTIYKQIYFGPLDTNVASAARHQGIRSFSLYPNPNSGSFTVSVEFYKKQDAVLQVWDGSGQLIMTHAFFETGDFSHPVNLPQQQNGNYLLRVISEFDSRRVQFIISK